MMAGSNLWEEVVRRSRLWVYMFGDIPFSPDDRRRSVDGSELWVPRVEYFPGIMRCQKL